MSPREEFHLETRAERRRRLLAGESGNASPQAGDPAPVQPGPYDLNPYGVHVYPDIVDAVVEYDDSPLEPLPYEALDPGTPRVDAAPTKPPPASPTSRPSAPPTSAPPGRPPAVSPADEANHSPHDVSPLATLAAGGDPASTAAALQLLAARAAAERLVGPGRSPSPSTVSAARRERERMAAERIASDRVAAARLAAVRAAAAGKGAAGTAPRAALTATPAPRRTAVTGAVEVAATAMGVVSSRETSGTAAGGAKPPGAGWIGRPVPRLRRRTMPRAAYAVAALAVLGVGAALTLPHIGALLPDGVPAAASSSPAGAPADPSVDPEATGTPSSAKTSDQPPSPAALSVMACEPASWTSRIADDPASAAAAKEFTAAGVAQAYCYTAGTLRSIAFSGLATRRPAGKTYTAADFAPVAAHLSPGLRTQWNQDVTDFAGSQDLRSEAGRRLSALSRLAWDNDAFRFDPAASERATDFAVGRPVTWTATGPDGGARLGLGFETGIVTHMLDAGGKPQGQILKRTYKLALVKGDAARPWLIDAYEVSEVTAALSTTNAAPGAAPRTAAPGATASATVVR